MGELATCSIRALKLCHIIKTDLATFGFRYRMQTWQSSTKNWDQTTTLSRLTLFGFPSGAWGEKAVTHSDTFKMPIPAVTSTAQDK